jgi:hypothetical protein
MNAAGLLLAGMAAAKRWPTIDPRRTIIKEVPKETYRHYVNYIPFPLSVREMWTRPSDSVEYDTERFSLDKFDTEHGVIRMGYSSHADTLFYWIPDRAR